MKKDYSAMESFLNVDIALIKQSKENLYIEPGESVYKFKIQLPATLPTR